MTNHIGYYHQILNKLQTDFLVKNKNYPSNSNPKLRISPSPKSKEIYSMLQQILVNGSLANDIPCKMVVVLSYNFS